MLKDWPILVKDQTLYAGIPNLPHEQYLTSLFMLDEEYEVEIEMKDFIMLITIQNLIDEVAKRMK